MRAGQLLRDDQPVPLRPKTWAVLLYLAQRPAVLVSKDELLDAIWPDVAVTPDTLTKSIGELRVALADDTRSPRYIETAHRRGFRFIAPITPIRGVASVSFSAPTADTQHPTPALVVGRETEIQRLERHLAQAHSGARQIAFVTGGAGIGKTTLLETFLDSLRGRPGLMTPWIGRGACVEQHGPREAYMPVLDALGRLARRQDGAKLIELLRRVAPTWLAQMPWLVGDDARASLQSEPAAKPDRMLREFAALIEALTNEVTVVLVLEDLHWSDPSTVDLLSVLGQRQEPAHLLVIGTYRPAEVAIHDHPLGSAVRTLRARRQSSEIPVHELSVENVRRYLEERFPDAPFPLALAPVLHQHTDGNPLFMVAVVEHMLSRGLILETGPGWALSVPLERADLGIPDGIAQMIEAQIEGLAPADRELLEVASASGIELTIPAIASVMDCDTATVETRCEALARARRPLRVAGSSEWPDGSVTRCYTFTHELYRQVVYGAVPDRRRMRLHQRLGEALETAYGERALEIAPALAVHFERSRDRLRAIPYLTIAGARARQRFANREALTYLEAALAAVAQLPDDKIRQRLELGVRTVLGPALADLHGYASESVRENYERADALAARAASSAEQFDIAYALCHFHAAHGNTEADAMATRLDTLAHRVGTAEARLRADSALVRIALVAGRFDETQAHMQRLVASRAGLPPGRQPEFGPDPVIDANSHYALALWFLGDPARARAISQANVEAARASGFAFTQAAALSLAGVLEIFCDNPAGALALADEAASVCSEGGFAYWHAMASAVRGQAHVLGGYTQEGLDELARARIALGATGAQVFSTHILAFLADAHRHNGTLAEARAAVDEGLAVAESSLDRTYLPELWRLKGEILLTMARPPRDQRNAKGPRGPAHADWLAAERCLVRALESARACRARSLELRAATSLARAWHARGKSADARAALAKVCRGFARDGGTSDIRTARLLLDALSQSPREPRPPTPLEPGRRIPANLPKTFRA